MDNGNRLSPVTLPGKYPVTKLKVYGLLSKTTFLNHCRSIFFKDRGLHSIPLTGIDHGSACLGICLGHIFNFPAVLCNNLNNGNVELLRKLKVPVIMSRHAHDGTGTVVGKDVIGKPDGYLGTA